MSSQFRMEPPDDQYDFSSNGSKATGPVARIVGSNTVGRDIADAAASS